MVNLKINAIVTMPPYAPYIDEVLKHRIVSGIRLNTVMPVKGSLEDIVKSLEGKAKNYGKELWVDLKCRQLRIKNYGVPPFTEIELTHDIEVTAPVKAYFSGGKESATVLETNGNKLIMQDGPRRVVGPGESINIVDPSLKIIGYLTDTDKMYVDACLKNNFHSYMLSFVEGKQDIDELHSYDGKANVIAKIESLKGLDYALNRWHGECRLMAARGDLYLELKMPHHIIEAEEKILEKDKNAIVASRLFDSLSCQLEPSCEDIGDADNLMRMGYKTFMLGDEVCMKRDSIISALNLLEKMSAKYMSGSCKAPRISNIS